MKWQSERERKRESMMKQKKTATHFHNHYMILTKRTLLNAFPVSTDGLFALCAIVDLNISTLLCVCVYLSW